jgi:hypothetical protein
LYIEEGKMKKLTVILLLAIIVPVLLAEGKTNTFFLDYAEKFADRIYCDDLCKASVLDDIAVRFSELGQRDRALSVFSKAMTAADKISNENNRSMILERLVGGLAENGSFNTAASATSYIGDYYYKSMALNDMAGK